MDSLVWNQSLGHLPMGMVFVSINGVWGLILEDSYQQEIGLSPLTYLSLVTFTPNNGFQVFFYQYNLVEPNNGIPVLSYQQKRLWFYQIIT